MGAEMQPGRRARAAGLHFDIYASPSGDRFVNVETDTGVVKSETEDRA